MGAATHEKRLAAGDTAKGAYGRVLVIRRSKRGASLILECHFINVRTAQVGSTRMRGVNICANT